MPWAIAPNAASGPVCGNVMPILASAPAARAVVASAGHLLESTVNPAGAGAVVAAGAAVVATAAAVVPDVAAVVAAVVPLLLPQAAATRATTAAPTKKRTFS